MKVPPPITDNLVIWAQALNRFLTGAFSKLDYVDVTSTAAESGAIGWAAAGYPVVTRDGAFMAIPMRHQVSVPSTATDPGVPGDMAWDGAHLYLCVSSDVWVRAAVATW